MLPPVADAARAGDPLRVLVVEDNQINQYVAKGLLENLGYRTEVAGDGYQAVELLAHSDYDVVFMDLQMPGLDGIGATAMVRQLPDGRGDLPIIAMTANAMAGDREACLVGGMNDYIAKPINRRELRELMDKWAQRLSPRRPVEAPKPPAPAPQAAAPRAVDPAFQGELKEILGGADFDKLLRQLAQQIDLALPAIHAALAEGDRNAAHAASHSLKGAARNLGFVALPDSLAEFELACRQDGEADWAGLIAAIETAAHQTQDWLTTTLQERVGS